MGLINTFVYAGKNIREFGVIIGKSGAYHAAERDYETLEVPGRNGDLTIDNGKFRNVSIIYECTIGRSFPQNMDYLFQWLMSHRGYNRLEDSIQPDYYRMARVSGVPDPEQWANLIGGTFEIEFDCMPQRFLKSGEEMREFTSAGTIRNHTLYDALPLIRVYGTGALGIGSTTITILSADGYTDLDCDIQDAYKGQLNCNQNIRLDSGSFPVLKPGDNGISLGTGITKIELTPRWWTI